MSLTSIGTPIFKVATNPTTTKTASRFFTSLFKNKGVQAGIGIASIGAAFGFTGDQVKQQTTAIPELSPVIMIIIVVAVLLVVLKR